METAKAARSPPNASRGKVYMFTLKAETAKMLHEMPAAAQAAVGARGMTAVMRESSAASTQARKRACMGATPRLTRRSDSPPPAKPPISAKRGGFQEIQADWTSVSLRTSTRYAVVQLVHSE